MADALAYIHKNGVRPRATGSGELQLCAVANLVAIVRVANHRKYYDLLPFRAAARECYGAGGDLWVNKSSAGRRLKGDGNGAPACVELSGPVFV